MKIIKNIVRYFVIGAFVAAVIFAIWLRGQYVVPILMYHHVKPRPIKELNTVTPKDFERQMREELGSKRKLTPEFLKEILEKRDIYREIHGSHLRFNKTLAEEEKVSVKAVEAWVAKAEALFANKAKSKLGKRKGIK